MNTESYDAKNLTIFRKAHNRENPYAQISKRVLRDNRLSAKEMGLMCYFLSLPDDWQINITELIRHFKDGEKSIRSGIRELISIGYIEIQRARGEMGRFSPTIYLIHEDPVIPIPEKDLPTKESKSIKSNNLVTSMVKPYAGFGHAVKRDSGFRNSAKGALLKTEVNKDRFNETEVTNIFNARATLPVDNVEESSEESLEHGFESFWQEYPNQVGKLKSKVSFFQKCIQKKLNPQVLVNAARAQRIQRERRQELGLMVPEIFKNPSGWLEEEKWEDVVQSEEQLRREAESKWNSKRTPSQLQVQKNNHIAHGVEARLASRREKLNVVDTQGALRKENVPMREFRGIE